jgi:hypothetical protein
MCDTLADIILDHWQNLKPRTLAAYAAMIKLSTDGVCTATQKELASTVGTSTRSIKRSVSDLKTLGIIQVEYFHDSAIQKTQNTYLLLRPMGQHVGPSPQTDGPKTRPMGQHVGPHVLLHTTTNIIEENQLTLIENSNAQNLGALDIKAQSHLTALGINPHLTQKFPNSPKICQEYTPAEILMFHDDTGKIADTLSEWRANWDAGIDVTQHGRYNPALMWVKIVEEALGIRSEAEQSGPKPEKEFSPSQELILAIAEVCTINLRLASGRKLKDIEGVAAKFNKAGITPTQVREWGERWYSEDWRARKGQAPTLKNLQDEWEQYSSEKGQDNGSNGQATPRANKQRNGGPSTGPQKCNSDAGLEPYQKEHLDRLSTPGYFRL